MKFQSYLRIFLLLPIVVSLGAVARPWFICIPSTEIYCFNSTITDFELFIGYYPIVFGGVPYLVFLVAALVWITRSQQISSTLFIVVAPLVFACMQFVMSWCYYLFLVSLENAFSYSVIISSYAIAYGYAYVLAMGVIWLLIKSVGFSSKADYSECR